MRPNVEQKICKYFENRLSNYNFCSPYTKFKKFLIFFLNCCNLVEHLKNGEIFFGDIHQKVAYIFCFSQFFLHILLIHDVKASENIKFQFSGAIQGVYRTPKIGCFFKFVKRQPFCSFVTQLVNKQDPVYDAKLIQVNSG